MKYRFGVFEFDEQLWELRQHDELIPIQRKALETVLFLIRNRGRVVSRDELRAELWPGTAVTNTAIAHAIMQARRGLGDIRGRWIRTVRGKGVRFVGHVEEDSCERPRSYERLNRAESATPLDDGDARDTSEFERQFLRCLHHVLGVAVEVARSGSLGTAMADFPPRTGMNDGALWELAQHFRSDQNVQAARHTLQYLVERYPRSALASEARVLLVQDPLFSSGSESVRESPATGPLLRRASESLSKPRPVSK